MLRDFVSGEVAHAKMMGSAACVLQGAVDTNGVFFPFDSLAKTRTFNGPGGAIDTITVGPDVSGVSRRRTITYTNGNPTSETGWVPV